MKPARPTLRAPGVVIDPNVEARKLKQQQAQEAQRQQQMMQMLMLLSLMQGGMTAQPPGETMPSVPAPPSAPPGGPMPGLWGG